MSAKERKEQLELDLDDHKDELKKQETRLSRPGQNRAKIQQIIDITESQIGETETNMAKIDSILLQAREGVRKSFETALRGVALVGFQEEDQKEEQVQVQPLEIKAPIWQIEEVKGEYVEAPAV